MTRVTLLDRKSVHIDGYKSILSFSDSQALIECHKRILSVDGEKLIISSFNGIQMEITGSISGVRWVE